MVMMLKNHQQRGFIRRAEFLHHLALIAVILTSVSTWAAPKPKPKSTPSPSPSSTPKLGRMEFIFGVVHSANGGDPSDGGDSGDEGSSSGNGGLTFPIEVTVNGIIWKIERGSSLMIYPPGARIRSGTRIRILGYRVGFEEIFIARTITVLSR
jgi:hypothetical protein